MPRLPLKPTAVLGVVRELRTATRDFAPLLVAGAPETAGRIVSALAEGAGAGAVRDLSGQELGRYDVGGADVLVYAVEGGVTEEDVAALRLADRHDLEVVCVVDDEGGGVVDVGELDAADVVEIQPGEPLPLERLVERIADRAGDDGYQLAARIPVLRRAVCEEIVRRFARQNAILAVAIFIPGADFPVLTLNQIRMVLRIAVAHGEEIDAERSLELLSIVGAGLGARELARNLVGLVPVLGWAVQGGIAFAATRALGEAAIVYFQAGAPGKLKDAVRSRS